MKNTKTIMLSVITIMSLTSVKFIGNSSINYIDAELVMVDVKVKIIGLSEMYFAQATANFYSPNNLTNSIFSGDAKSKIYNRDVYVNDVSFMYANSDSTYKVMDTTLTDINSNNFTWAFTDLTDTNNVIQFTTTKPINRINNFDLSSINSVSKSNDFVFSHPNIIADSVVYVLGADSLTSLKKTIYNNSYGITFSQSELSQLNSTDNGAFIMLVFNSDTKIYNNRKYLFQNNSSIMVLPLPIY